MTSTPCLGAPVDDFLLWHESLCNAWMAEGCLKIIRAVKIHFYTSSGKTNEKSLPSSALVVPILVRAPFLFRKVKTVRKFFYLCNGKSTIKRSKQLWLFFLVKAALIISPKKSYDFHFGFQNCTSLQWKSWRVHLGLLKQSSDCLVLETATGSKWQITAFITWLHRIRGQSHSNSWKNLIVTTGVERTGECLFDQRHSASKRGTKV